ncbi:MAG: transcription antitermination factor NusB [Steroidobacteraceae bacterium]|jgi:N utilization substance protein B|nr:transcription antitermination factor NusB [Steroidobacteraceae bacterium]
MARESEARALARGRRAARRILVQALYQLQVGGHPWQDVHQQFQADPESEGADRAWFRELLMNVAENRDGLDATLTRWSDIPPAQLDPLEHGILWLGLYELTHRLDVPYRVVISEYVELAKRFGATDGHKFVNGVLDRAARELRAVEYGDPA